MATGKVITKYVGRLSLEQAADGIAKALKNARSLLEDAELLVQHHRWARASALAILAIEEAGKVPLIRGIVLAETDSELREEWRAYRSHTKKNMLWVLRDLAARGARFFDELSSAADPASDHPELLEAIKQVAFYSDAYGACRWSSPSEDIPEDFARSLVSLAGIFTRSTEGLTTVAELALWVKHMRPVWKGPRWELSQALAACYKEAEETGVLRSGASASEMTKFLFGID